MQKIINYFLILAAFLLVFGVYKIETMPQINEQSFSAEAADATNVQFNELFHGKVVTVESKDEEQNKHYARITENLQVFLLGGSQKGKTVEVVYDDTLTNAKLQEVHVGDGIVVGSIAQAGQISYVLVDRYRLDYLAYIGLLFLALAILFGRLRGFTSVIGLLASIGILIFFVTPNILAGKNPVLVTLVGAGIIAFVSMFLAHGFNSRTKLAITATLLTLGIAEGLAAVFIMATKLLGNGSEEAFYLQTGYFGNINLQGLLLGGIIIGTLGVLNDITTAQSATVEELHLANQNFSWRHLYSKASSVGREHIASLINTLALTYVGASLPLFLLFTINTQPLWTVLNSGSLAEEIVRTFVGSIALIFAVPITTALAAYYWADKKDRK